MMSSLPSRSQEEIREICAGFAIYGDFLVAVPFGSGHINDTYQVTYDQGGVRLHYTLQRINHSVFKKPEQVMENIDRVTAHLLNKIRSRGEETRKRTLRLLRTFSNRPFVQDKRGDYWRAYVFVENARSYDVLESPKQAYLAARAFGEFQCDLVDLPGRGCMRRFRTSITRRSGSTLCLRHCGRPGRSCSRCEARIDFVMKRRDETELLLKLHAQGAIPERITHNDTKSNNILIDDLTGEGVCVIDLDTVMPGLSLYDFGDMVRGGTSPAEEDEVNLDKVGMRFEMFEALLRGFLRARGVSDRRSGRICRSPASSSHLRPESVF